MLRSTFIYLSRASWARRMVTHWGVARRTASRFVAGETLEDALQVIRTLNAKNILATLDHLGENTTNPEEAKRATQEIMNALKAIHANGLRANVSIKLTQIGLRLGKELCAENLRYALEAARSLNNFIRIDMEDSPWVEDTLTLYRHMQERGLTNCGVVIQSYLHRSEADVRRLVEEGARVRLCKGAYKEPAEVAYPRKRDVDRNYDRLAELLIQGVQAHGAPPLSTDGRTPPLAAFATHDVRRILHAQAYASQMSLPKESIEFQMLYGIRRDLQEQIAAQGYPVRVYVPYGSEWYPYFMRRLAERPANLWFFISNFFRR